MELMITDPVEFRKLRGTLDRAVVSSARMPARVFRPGYGRFQFLEFDLFGSNEFWAMLRQFMERSQDDRVNLMVLEPDPEGYFYSHFGHFAAAEFSRDISAERYRAVLEAAPKLSPADALTSNTEVLVWFPTSLRWVVWGERRPEILVLGVEKGFDDLSAQMIEEAGMCPLSVEDALDISAPAWRDRAARERFAHELMANYSHGGYRPDPPTVRAIRVAGQLIAGEIGVIEACRELSALRFSFGNECEEQFLPFAGIDSETDDLPVGPVRREWNAEALTRKDIEIARCEQLYRDSAVDACRALIERLRRTRG